MAKRKIEYKTIITDSGSGSYINRLLIGTAATGLVRVEWVGARYGQIIPVNWSMVTMQQFLNSYIPLRYQVADAQNLVVKAAIEGQYEWCFRGDTVVETATGGKKIRDVIPGELVKTHLGRFRPVIRTMKREIKQHHPTIWIKTEHSTIKCTEGHPFLVLRSGAPEWVRADSLCLTDCLLYPCPVHEDWLDVDIKCNTNGAVPGSLEGSIKNGKTITRLPVTRELARFLGLYLAEGHSERDAIALTFNNNETDLAEFVSNIYRDVFGRQPTIRSNWSTQVRLNIRNLSPRFREWFGTNAREKQVPAFVFEWNILNRLEFLKGYLDGDGSYRSDGRIAYASASSRLMEGIDKLICDCGLEPAPQYIYDQTVTHIGDQELRGTVLTQGGIPKKSVEKLMDLLGATYADDHLHIPVKAIEQHPLAANLIDSAVYNLEVEEDNSYIADCAAVHNCLLYEHDVLPPVDAFVRLNRYIREASHPLVSGLYFTRSMPSEPLIFRGRGTSYYDDWQLGDLVYCDGVPTGFLLIHCDILKAMWEDAPEYVIKYATGVQTRAVFETPRHQWIDPEKQSVFSTTGTSDLDWCTRVIQGDYLHKAGWGDYADSLPDPRYPFVVDTNILCSHIDPDGRQYPTPEELKAWKQIKDAARTVAGD